MVHIPDIRMHIIEIERIAMDSLFDRLTAFDNDSRVLVNPTEEEYERYGYGHQCVFIKPLVSQSPTLLQDSVRIPSVEKILVDIAIGSPELNFAEGSELHNIYRGMWKTGMKQTGGINMYEGLASYFLPPGVFEYFEVADFSEESSVEKDVLYSTILHIYLDERDNRTPDMAGSVSDGFGEESCLMDFPARGKKTILHVRRRWTMPDGATRIVDLDSHIQLRHPGTRYSKDFALF